MNPKTKFKIILSNDVGFGDSKKRKGHQRTRFGCLTCKAKKVKCDELKPVCTRCLRNARPCRYENSGAPQRGTPSLSHLNSFTFDPLTSMAMEQRTFSIDVVRHFQRSWEDIIHMPGSQKIISLSQNNSSVYNAVLATSACHLRHISHGSQITKHRVAEYSHMSLAIRQYQSILSAPRETLGKSGAEFLLISAMLLNILIFPLLDSYVGLEESTSWLFGSGEEMKGWLAMQAGIKPLILSASTQLHDIRTLLGETIFGCDGSNWPTPSFRLNLAVLPDAWVEAFNLHNQWSADVFGLPIAILRKLQVIKPLRGNVYRNLLFAWKMSVDFRNLLYEKDVRALWLCGYWLGLLCRYNGVWWCDKPAKSGHQAIRTFLGQLHLPGQPGREGESWSKMMSELELVPVSVST